MRIDRKLLVQYLVVLFAIPFLYILSSGPILLLAKKADDDRRTFAVARRIYRPLLRLAPQLHLEKPLSAYLRIWGLIPFQVMGKTGTPRNTPLNVL